MTDFANKIQTVRDALIVLAENEGDIAELLSEAKVDKIPAYVIGQFLMEVLPFPDSGFNVEQKEFWLEVLEHMGPDWIAELSTVTAFMKKVDGFN